MAYINQDDKKRLTPGIKAVLNKYGMKGSLSISNKMKLVCKLKSGKLDIIGNVFKTFEERGELSRLNPDVKAFDVNHYRISDMFTGEVKDFLLELRNAMMVGNHDNSDAQTDYFDVGWYIGIIVGDYTDGYILTEGERYIPKELV